MTTRFPHGVTNAAKGTSLDEYIAPDPTKVHIYFNDFDTYVVGDWTITTTEAGAGDATEALTDENGGVLLITNDAADNDADFFQKVGESYLLAAGKRAWFKCRFKCSTATEIDWVIGLQVTDTTPLAVTDGIFFQKDDGDTQIDFYVRKDTTTGSTTAQNIATFVAATYITLGWYFDGVGTVHYYVNDARVGQLSGTSTYLPDTELTVSFGVQNGDANARTMSIDYILAAMER